MKRIDNNSYDRRIKKKNETDGASALVWKVKVKDFDLAHIFECGQAFRWRALKDGSYTGVAWGRIVNLSFDGQGTRTEGVLTIRSLAGGHAEDRERIWKPYLDLARDYGKIKAKLVRADEQMAPVIAAGSGIRILQQDLWEVILSFLISQNNNIPRIQACIERLARLCGTFIAPDGDDIIAHGYANALLPSSLSPYTLPMPEQLAALTQEDLSPVRLGYRAKYLIETAKRVAEHGLPTDRKALLSCRGIGNKVADCISLFALRDTAAFPMDVWMKRVMAALYGLPEDDVRAQEAFAVEKYGNLAGYAQQYLYFYARQGGMV